MFDGLLVVGWKGINEFDMVMMLDVLSVVFDLFIEDVMLNICCDILEFVIM